MLQGVWYLSLPDGGIKTMEKLEEPFLKRWSMKEDPNMLLTRLNSLWKHENESIREFHTRFETLLQNIPTSHHLNGDYLVHIYTKYVNGQLRYFSRTKTPNPSKKPKSSLLKLRENSFHLKLSLSQIQEGKWTSNQS
jgi:hypothetical protein